MTSILVNLLLTLLKSDTVQNLALGLITHLADKTTHPLTHEGLTVIQHILNGTVDITFPVTVESAITDVAEIAVDAVKVHKGS